MTQWQETYSQIRPDIWKKSELPRLGFVSFARVRNKNLAPYQWDVIQHVQIGATEGATWMGWAAKMEAPRPLVNHPSIPQPSNLQTFKLQPNKPNKLQETHLRQRQTTTWWSCHTKVPPFPEVEPTRSSVQGAGPAQGQWCQAQRPEHQGTVQTMPLQKLEDWDFRWLSIWREGCFQLVWDSDFTLTYINFSLMLWKNWDTTAPRLAIQKGEAVEELLSQGCVQ